MAQQWQFEEDDQKQWHWQRTEDVAKSAKSFPSAVQCMLDAVKFAVQRRRAEAEQPRQGLLQ